MKKETNKKGTMKKQFLFWRDVNKRVREECLDHFHLGEQDEDSAEAMYLDSDSFDWSDEKIKQYEIKNNISLNHNVFCFDCINVLDKDLENEVQL
jgi:hypothetical protein